MYTCNSSTCLFNFYIKNNRCVSVLLECLNVYAGFHIGQKRTLDRSLRTALEDGCDLHIGAGNQNCSFGNVSYAGEF